jgi:hypothetical protein
MGGGVDVNVIVGVGGIGVCVDVEVSVAVNVGSTDGVVIHEVMKTATMIMDRIFVFMISTFASQGTAQLRIPRQLSVEHPLTGGYAETFWIRPQFGVLRVYFRYNQPVWGITRHCPQLF